MNRTGAPTKSIRNAIRIIALAALTAPGLVWALEIQAQFAAGVGYSDNIGRTPSNEVGETIRTLALDFNLQQKTRRLDADIRSTFDYMDYVDNTFDSELVGGLVARADYAIAEDRLFWLFQYNWGQQLQDLFEVARPDNRENVYSLLTGPRLVLPLGNRNAIVTDLQYTNTRYEFQPYDFESGAAILQFGREFRDNKTLSINGSGRRFEFKDDQFPSYDQTEAYIRYEGQSERNTITLDAGYTEVDSEGQKGDGMLLRADWTRKLSAVTTLQVGAGSQYSDQGDIFRFFQNVTQNLDVTNSVIAFGSPFRNNYLNASVEYTAERSLIAVNFIATTERYELVPTNALDRDYYGFELDYNREMSRKFFAGASVFYRSIDYRTQSRTDTDRALNLNLGYRFSAAFNLALQYQLLSRKSTDALSESTENRTMLRFGYIPSWGR